jgi:hypothetical protein
MAFEKIRQVFNALFVNNSNITQNVYNEKPIHQNWDSWSRGILKKNNKYFPNEYLTNKINEIQDLINKENVQAFIRINGLAGLGKTRLVHEVFDRKKKELEKKELEKFYERFIIFNAADNSSKIKSQIEDEVNLNAEIKIFIVDNCDLSLHNDLVEIIRYTKNYQLITIYFEPNEGLPPSTRLITLKDKEINDIIPQLIKDFHPNLLQSDVDKITSFAQGFPQIAVQLGEARLLDSNMMLTDDVLLEKIIGSKEYHDAKYMSVLKACAIFSEIGFYPNLDNQKNFVATSRNICRLKGIDVDKISDFEDVCTTYMNKGIIEKVGRFIILKPKPLAIKLAADWWKDFVLRGGDGVILIEEINENGLLESLCKQVSYLDFSIEAKEITANLCEDNASFGQTEVINTDAGSRLFRALAEVNPEVITETLYTHYADADKETLQSVRAGRRNLVWALEKLCFRKETFEKATTVMMAFAYGENESYGNNATAQFIGLFQVVLAGTEVNLEKRLKIIKYSLDRAEFDYKRLALNGIAKGLAYYGNSLRMLGAEAQGSSADLIDYKPTFKEAQEYTKNLIDLLVEAACSDEEHHIIAIKRLEDSIRNIYANKHGKFVPDALRQVHASKGRVFWKKAFINLLHTIEFEQRKLPVEEVSELNKLVNEFAPQTFDEYYQIFIGDGTFWKIDDNGTWSMATSKEILADDYSEANISVFVNKFIDDLPNWNYDLIITTISNNGYFLGKVLAEKLDAASSDVFINNCIDAIKTVTKEKLNLIVLGSFLQSCADEDIRREALKSVSQTVEFNQIISLTAFLNLSLEELKNLVHNSQKQGTDIEEFNRFCYGRALAHLTDDEIIEFSNTLKEYGERGVWVALHIISTYFREDEAKILSFKDDIKTLFKVDGAIENIDKTGGIWLLIINRYIEIILKNDADEEFIQILLDASINHIKNTEYFGINDLIKRILTLLLTDYFNQTWYKLGELFITDYWKLKSFLGAESGIYHNKEGVLFMNSSNYSTIIEWCKNSLDEAPWRIATISPIFNKSDDNKLHPFAKLFIDEFGDREDVRNNFNANLNPFTSVGSRIPYLQDRIELLKELQNHQIKEVRSWVASEITRFKADIKEEKIRNEEDGIR